MSTDGGTTQASRSGATRRTPDPLQMSAAEKCMAEWEARHDVAARGHRAPPDALQHYVAHSRLTEPARPHPAGAAAPTHRERPAPPVAEQPRPRTGSLLARLLRRRG